MKMLEKGCDLQNAYVPQNKLGVADTPSDSYINGIIYKQSQFRKVWELRYIIIGPNGLFSYKDAKSSESFKIIRDTATEIWTRFEIR